MEPRGVKIAIVANTTWYLYNFRRNLMLALREQGHELIAVGSTDGYVQSLVAEGIVHKDVLFTGSGTNPLRELRTVLALRSIFRSESVDVVLSYTPKGNIYAALALLGLDGELVANVSGLGRAFVRDGPLTLLVRRLYRYAFRRARRVFFQNEDDRQMFLHEGLVDQDKSCRLPGSGIDLQRFAPCTPANACSIARVADGATFLLVARLLWDKGIGEYVEAARVIRREYPDARFRLLGFLDPPGKRAVPIDTLRAWVAEGVIEYLGTTDDVRPHLEAADCVVLPSVYREGVPRSLLEAAAMGKALIATDSIGCRDAVDDNVTGYLCRPSDSVDLADKMRAFLHLAPAARLAMGRRGREKMEQQFDEKIVIRAYSDVVRQCAAAAPSAAS
jgi:glycosyltransferase involved in cell wall biosynthesis